MSASARTLTKRLYVPAPVELRDSTLRPEGVDGDRTFSTRVIDVRGAMEGIGERPGLAPAYWGIDLTGPSDTLRLTLRHGNTAFGDILDRRQSILSLCNGSEILAEKDVSAFETSSGTYNTLRVTIDRQTGTLLVSGGGKRAEDIFSFSIDGSSLPDGFSVWSRGHLTLSSLSVEDSLSPEQAFSTEWTHDRLTEYLSDSSDPNEGYWQFLDRENDPRYARPGGRYMLATVKSDDGYDIIYVDGADIRRDQWKPMMLKGHLGSTIFLDHYDLRWIDSTFDMIDRDIHASITDGSILTLSFPLLKTTLRFSKLPLRRSQE
ncbi:MAG: hypothetical protein NC411_05770 [Bacteroides sp.]|nr:hypothetical protein [Bacteroides sp.]